MDQVTTFSPPLYVRLIDGSLVKFARSTMDHWVDLSEQMAAEKRERLERFIAAETTMKPLDRVNAREQAAEAIVTVDRAIDRCRSDARWIKRHLTAAFIEGRHPALYETPPSAAALQEARDDAAASLKLIPSIDQMSIADQIAMLPVVKNAKAGTEENPLVAGREFGPDASTGGASAPPSGDGTPDSPPAE